MSDAKVKEWEDRARAEWSASIKKYVAEMAATTVGELTDKQAADLGMSFLESLTPEQIECLSSDVRLFGMSVVLGTSHYSPEVAAKVLDLIYPPKPKAPR